MIACVDRQVREAILALRQVGQRIGDPLSVLDSCRHVIIPIEDPVSLRVRDAQPDCRIWLELGCIDGGRLHSVRSAIHGGRRFACPVRQRSGPSDWILDREPNDLGQVRFDRSGSKTSDKRRTLL